MQTAALHVSALTPSRAVRRAALRWLIGTPALIRIGRPFVSRGGAR